MKLHDLVSHSVIVLAFVSVDHGPTVPTERAASRCIKHQRRKIMKAAAPCGEVIYSSW